MAGEQKVTSGNEPIVPLDDIPVDDMLNLYLKEMVRTPLLSAEEEVELAKAMEKGIEARQKLERGDVGESREELELLVEQGMKARDRLIRANTRLVVSVASSYRHKGLSFLDLIQEGNMGLIKAVEKFDYHRGYKFSTYAMWWIRQAIGRAIDLQVRTIRLPEHISAQVRKLHETARQIEGRIGRTPTEEEIGERMGVSAKRVRWLLKMSQMPLSLDMPMGEGDQFYDLASIIPDEEAASVPDIVDQQLLHEQIEELLRTLSPREERILQMRFGFTDGNPLSLKEVGDKFGVTRERIRQIEVNALNRLRSYCRSSRLRAFFTDIIDDEEEGRG